MAAFPPPKIQMHFLSRSLAVIMKFSSFKLFSGSTETNSAVMSRTWAYFFSAAGTTEFRWEVVFEIGRALDVEGIKTVCKENVMKEQEKRWITRKEKFSLSFASVNSYLISGLVASYLLYFYTDIFLLPMAAVPVIMGVARIWDTVNDPVMGILIDRSKSGKHGRMRKYFLYFAVPMAVFTALLFASPNLAAPMKIIYAVVTYFLFDTLYTVVDIPLWSLISVSTPNAKERAKTLSLVVTVGSAGSVIPMLVVPLLSDSVGERKGYFIFAVITALLVLSALLLVYRHGNERVKPVSEEKLPVREIISVAFQNKPMLLTLLASILSCTRYLLQISAVYVASYNIKSTLDTGTVQIILVVFVSAGMLAGMLITPPLYTRFGYKKVYLFFGVMGALVLGGAYFAGYSSLGRILPFLIVGGIPIGVYSTITYPMVGDSLDYLEWKTGQRMEGFCFSLQSSMTKFNNAFAAITVSVFLVAIRFNQPVADAVGNIVKQAQTQSTLNGIYALVSLLPAIGFALSLIPMFFYDFDGKKKERILMELENQRKEKCRQLADNPLY